MFDQFERNMQTLIRKARSDGYTPVVTNCYARNDFTPEDYQFIKEMNLKSTNGMFPASTCWERSMTFQGIGWKDSGRTGSIRTTKVRRKWPNPSYLPYLTRSKVVNRRR